MKNNVIQKIKIALYIITMIPYITWLLIVVTPAIIGRNIVRKRKAAKNEH